MTLSAFVLLLLSLLPLLPFLPLLPLLPLLPFIPVTLLNPITSFTPVTTRYSPLLPLLPVLPLLSPSSSLPPYSPLPPCFITPFINYSRYSSYSITILTLLASHRSEIKVYFRSIRTLWTNSSSGAQLQQVTGWTIVEKKCLVYESAVMPSASNCWRLTSDWRMCGRFADYGQCDNLANRENNSWWIERTRSFAARQMSMYEREMGWVFWTWKLEDHVGEPSKCLGERVVRHCSVDIRSNTAPRRRVDGSRDHCCSLGCTLREESS